MPTEAQIRKKAIEIFKRNKWIYWYPKKVKWQETDIFGVFDIILIKSNNRFQFIQLTSLPNIRAREKKIRNWLEKNKIKSFPAEVWGWCKNRKEFKKIKV